MGKNAKENKKKKAKKNHANESMQSQRGQNVKPSRDMNHRDSQRDSHAMSTRGALFTFSRLSAAPAPKRWWERGVEGRDSVPHYATLSQCPIYASCRVRVASTLTDKRSKPWGAVSREIEVGGETQRGSLLTTWTRALSVSPPSLSPSLPLTLAACPVWIRFSSFFLWLFLFLFCFLLLPCLSGSACLLFISYFMRIRAFLFIPLHSAVLFCCPLLHQLWQCKNSLVQLPRFSKF